ncbi:MAG TPA: hypothetical protein VLL57_03415 [Candidatus Binataceae bacterium]|nr:hypothetical protein [Candidatus Binataceae bacterium]
MAILQSLRLTLMHLTEGWRHVRPHERALLAVVAAGASVYMAIRDTEKHDAMPIAYGLAALLMLGYAASIVVDVLS